MLRSWLFSLAENALSASKFLGQWSGLGCMSGDQLAEVSIRQLRVASPIHLGCLTGNSCVLIGLRMDGLEANGVLEQVIGW